MSSEYFTFRQVINRVMILLREFDERVDSGATELTTNYQKLVGEYVNMVKEDIENAYDWQALYVVMEYELTTIDEQRVFAINTGTEMFTGETGSSLNTSFTLSNHARLARYHISDVADKVPMCFDTTDSDTTPLRLTEWTPQKMAWNVSNDPTTTDTVIQGFNIRTRAANSAEADNALYLELYPTLPNATTKKFRIGFINPQDRLQNDEVSNLIYVPAKPLVLGTYLWALEERGEELGPRGDWARQKYREALDDAISRENTESGEIRLRAT